MLTLNKKQQREQEQRDAVAILQGWLKPGMVVNTILRKVSSSGMYRHISLLINVNGETVNISWYAAKAMGDKFCDNDNSIGVGGCGMDMGFHLVYNLGRTLFPQGFILPKGMTGRNGDKGKIDEDGGYALKQQWI